MNKDLTQRRINLQYTKFEQNIMDECLQLACTLINKNREYGDSHSKQLEKYGLVSLIIRLNDKISRLESIYEKEDKDIVFESAMDTVTDIAGYCMLTKAIKRLEGDSVE